MFGLFFCFFLIFFLYFVVLNVETPILSTDGLQNQPAAYQQSNCYLLLTVAVVSQLAQLAQQLVFRTGDQDGAGFVYTAVTFALDHQEVASKKE